MRRLLATMTLVAPLLGGCPDWDSPSAGHDLAGADTADLSVDSTMSNPDLSVTDAERDQSVAVDLAGMDLAGVDLAQIDQSMIMPIDLAVLVDATGIDQSGVDSAMPRDMIVPPDMTKLPGPIELRGDFVGAAISGQSNGIELRLQLHWGGPVRGANQGTTLEGWIR